MATREEEDKAKRGSSDGALRPATIRDVGRLAGVGVGTVSRFVNGSGYVKAETRERIRQAIETLNFEPNALAASLRGTASRVAGIVVPDISNPLFAGIIKSLEERLRAARYSVILTSPSGDPANELGIVESLLARRIEAMFLAPCQEISPALEVMLRKANIPSVILDRYLLLGEPGFAHILTDHSGGMEEAMCHLVETGHRNIFLPYVATNRPGIERARAFRDYLARPEASGIVGTTSEGSQYTDFATKATLAQLRSGNPPDAILVGHNQMLPRVLAALRIEGLKVGKDISIISSDRTDVAEFHDPPIAGITRSLGEIGGIAFDLFRKSTDDRGAAYTQSVATGYEPTSSVRDLRERPMERNANSFRDHGEYRKVWGSHAAIPVSDEDFSAG